MLLSSSVREACSATWIEKNESTSKQIRERCCKHVLDGSPIVLRQLRYGKSLQTRPVAVSRDNLLPSFVVTQAVTVTANSFEISWRLKAFDFLYR